MNKQECDNRYSLKMGSMIISGVLGLIALIGTFWGRPGLIATGIGTCLLFVIIISIIGNSG